MQNLKSQEGTKRQRPSLPACTQYFSSSLSANNVQGSQLSFKSLTSCKSSATSTTCGMVPSLYDDEVLRSGDISSAATMETSADDIVNARKRN